MRSILFHQASPPEPGQQIIIIEHTRMAPQNTLPLTLLYYRHQRNCLRRLSLVTLGHTTDVMTPNVYTVPSQLSSVIQSLRYTVCSFPYRYQHSAYLAVLKYQADFLASFCNNFNLPLRQVYSLVSRTQHSETMSCVCKKV